MSNKVANPKGTRDFTPEVMRKRNYLYNVIKKYFVSFGFDQIETPAMEQQSTLMGKYGDEGDKLIFKILNSGNYFRKRNTTELPEDFSTANYDDWSKAELVKFNQFTGNIAKKALRYDLTVPFARFVVQHQNDLPFPFKRFQIQPVWRADRPQKGRYQEFYQCDADIVGSDSLLYEVDFIQMFDGVLSDLGLNDFVIKINNRKILTGIAELIGMENEIVAITVAIDKLDKIGKQGVIDELTKLGLDPSQMSVLTPFLDDSEKDNFTFLNEIKEKLADSAIALKGIEELEFILNKTEKLGLNKAKVRFDVTLARGLNYYTGTIFEVVTNEVKMGSICGGGRYDNLTGIFGLSDMSGVGISFGADRIFDVLEELNLFPDEINNALDLLWVNFGSEGEDDVLKKIKELRGHQIKCEFYPEPVKMKKQMKYADQRSAKFVALMGDQEYAKKVVTIKNMISGDQSEVELNKLSAFLTAN